MKCGAAGRPGGRRRRLPVRGGDAGAAARRTPRACAPCAALRTKTHNAGRLPINLYLHNYKL